MTAVRVVKRETASAWNMLGWSPADGTLGIEVRPANGGPSLPVRLTQTDAEDLYDALQAALLVDPEQDGAASSAWGQE